ncbi:hypothetical protein ACIQTN_29470 [Streptomyces werraensis]|uniref:hypothetical protein n=1 Tax=Streptomyces werraensis TaxID=68284 RepID=UPI0038129181
MGLCLADGTPIAVTVVRDCAGTVTSEGWLNLVTGAWSAGAPPAGVVACGDSRSITTNGTFCDVLEDGTVAGLVLVEYQYAADGSIASVRLVDAVTGTTYTPTGEVTTCPAGVEQPERDLLQLCDVAEDGTTTAFVRDYARDEAGQFTGHADYTLDGQPYTPTGTVGLCQPEAAEPCASTVTVLRLCDLDPNVEPDEDGKRCAVPFLRHLVHDCTGALVETRDTTTDGTTPYTATEAVDCGGGGGVPAMVEVPWEVVGIEPDPASPVGRGLIFTLSPIDDPSTVGTVKVTTSSSYGSSSCPATPPAYAYRNPTTYTFTPDQALRDAATYVRCDLIDFDNFEPVTNLTPAPDRLGGTAYWDGTTVRPTENNKTGEMYYDGPPETWSYRVGNTGGGNSCSMLSFAAVSLRAEGCCAPCGTSGGGDGSGRTVQEVCVIANTAPANVMTWTRVIEDGGATIYYLDQNGARYDNTLPAGHQIVACPAEEPEPCRDAATVLLCDLPDAEGTSGPTTATDTTPIEQTPTNLPLPGGAPALWSGGTVVFPADPDASATDGASVYRTIAAALQADRPACDDGTARVTASLHVRQDGPAPGVGTTGRMNLYEAGTRVATVGVPASAPVGYEDTLTLSHTVNAAALAAGDVIVELRLETFHGGGKSWTVNQFTSTAEFDTATCETQFLRKVVTDCDTGEVVSVTDTTLDGQPYTVTGEVGQCTPAGGGEDVPECQSCEILTLCDVQPDESPGEPEITYETVPLAELGPAGSYGDGSPVTGTLPNGVGYSVNVGEWAGPQGHYTFYPGDNPQVWTFDQPVYVRFGLRGLNITPTECYVLPEGVVVESISPNHTWDAASRTLCEITGQSSATDESVFLLGPVTELPLTASGNSTGGRGPGLIQAGLAPEVPAPGSSTTFLRTICRDCQGQILGVTDTELDGETPYTPTGEVTACTGGDGGGTQPLPDGRDVALIPMCVVDNTTDAVLARVLAEVTYDTATGERLGVNYVDPLTWGPVPVPGGAHIALCPAEEPEPVPDVEVVQLCDLADGEDPVPFLRHLTYTPGASAPVVVDTALDGVTPYTLTGTAGACATDCPVQVIQACRCDDSDGDGLADTDYVELLAVDCAGQLSSLGTYLPDLSAPYTPTAPVSCEETGEGADPAVVVQARRIELAAGASWDAAAFPTLQSVTAVARGASGTITTADGASSLQPGESVTWSVARDQEAALAGPLVIEATSGTVTVSFTVAATA